MKIRAASHAMMQETMKGNINLFRASLPVRLGEPFAQSHAAGRAGALGSGSRRVGNDFWQML
jgi:hypothetical protein